MIERAAVLSDCGQYRYRLSRWWGPGRRLVFLMCNPSTADHEVDDATIRKCMGFARRWNYDGIEVVNLFALRSRDPKALATAADPVGPHNLQRIRDVLKDATEVVCAWGCEDALRKARLEPLKLLGMIHALRPQVQLLCLGRTKGGTPRHPLMLAYATKAEDFSPWTSSRTGPAEY